MGIHQLFLSVRGAVRLSRKYRDDFYPNNLLENKAVFAYKEVLKEGDLAGTIEVGARVQERSFS